MGIAQLDNKNLTLQIIASVFFYGEAASEELSVTVARDIQEHWNKPQGTVVIKNILYKTVFTINGIFAPHLTPADVYENDNPQNNYFRIEEFCALHISFTDGIGCNTGYFKLDNLLNNSTTAAHEFGHTLGLIHPHQLDIRGAGTPGIMYPRGTITDPHFQYDPAAAPATKGGTLNPIYRKVLQQDVNNLQLHKLSFNKNGKATIGKFSSLWHSNHRPADNH